MSVMSQRRAANHAHCVGIPPVTAEVVEACGLKARPPGANDVSNEPKARSKPCRLCKDPTSDC